MMSTSNGTNREMTGKKPNEIFDIDGLSRYLDISKSTLYKLAQDGKVPGQKIGKHWRFRKETINKWLDDAGQEATDEDTDTGRDSD